MLSNEKSSNLLDNAGIEAIFLDAANAFEGIEDDCAPVGKPRDDSGMFFEKLISGESENTIDIGEWSDEFMNREITFMLSPRKEWGADSAWRKTRAGKKGWLAESVTWRDFINAFDNPQVSPDKNGTMFVLAELTSADAIARTKVNVKTIYGMVFDLDNGQPEEEIFPALIQSGWHFVYCPSHSNGKTRTEIEFKTLKSFDETVFEKLKNWSDETADLESLSQDIKRYFKSKGYHASIVDSARVVKVENDYDPFGDSKSNKKPACVIVDHAPITKARVILPLSTPFVVREGNVESALAIEADRNWIALYNHVGTSLGLDFDPACKDISRAFYSARCKPRANYRAVFGGSTPLVLPECTAEMREAVGFKDQEKRKAALVKREKRRGKKLDSLPQIDDFLWQNEDIFDGVVWLEELGWETRGENRDGKIAIRCPNEEEHTEQKADDVGAVAMNPEAARAGRFILSCQHAHCRHFDTGDLMQMICEKVAEEYVDFDMPALEDFVRLADESAGSDSADPSAPVERKNGKPKYLKLRKILAGSAYAVNKIGWVTLAEVEPEKKGKQDKSEAQQKPLPICRAFEPLDLSRDENADDWGLRFNYRNRDSKERETVVSLYDIKKDRSDIGAQLYKNGMHVKHHGKPFNWLLERVVDYTRKRSVMLRKPGWRPDRKAFVCPDGMLIGVSVGEGVRLNNALSGQRAGSLEGQLRALDIALTHGGPHYLIGCLAGVAGVLVQYAGLDSTPVVTLSGTSSRGKTIAMKFAASMFGFSEISKGDSVGLLHSLRSTPNAVEFLAERSNGTFLGLDETAQGDISTKLEELIFMLAGGSGKHRMKADATERQTKGWETFALVSSEHPLAKLVERMGRSARVGFTARVADIDVSKARLIAETEHLEMKRLLSANYGWIGPKFVEHILASGVAPETVRDAIDAKARALAGDGASSLVGRSAGVFAVLWQAGEMLGKAGLLPDCLAEGEGERRIREIWEVYQSSSEAEALDPTAKAIQTLRETLVARMGRDVHPRVSDDSRHKFAETVAWYEGPERPGDAFAVDDDTEVTRFYVRCDKLAELAGDAVGAGVLCEALEGAKILKRDKDDKFSHRHLKGVGSVRHYPLDFCEEGRESA